MVDMDTQGSSVRWAAHRPEERPTIECIEGHKNSSLVTRSWQMRSRPGSTITVVDTPAAIEPRELPEIIRGAGTILVPVMPSEIDIHATARCIADLLLVAKVRRSENRLGIVANRVRANTRVSKSLMRFLGTLDIPLVATLRDTQNYVHAAQHGISVFEMPAWQTRQDVASWQGLLQWITDKRQVSGATRKINLEQDSRQQEANNDATLSAI